MAVIRALSEIFETHDAPKSVISNNGSQFSSFEFKQFISISTIKNSLKKTTNMCDVIDTIFIFSRQLNEILRHFR